MSDNANPPKNDSASTGARAVATPPAATAHVALAPAAAPVESTIPASQSGGDEVATLREQMLVDRFDAVAARAGIAEDYTEVALELFRKTGKEPTRENLGAFCKDLKAKRPALFGPQPASTAPAPANAVPAAPAPGAVSTPHEQWRALKAAGRKAEADVFYAQHRAAINRAAQ